MISRINWIRGANIIIKKKSWCWFLRLPHAAKWNSFRSWWLASFSGEWINGSFLKIQNYSKTKTSKTSKRENITFQLRQNYPSLRGLFSHIWPETQSKAHLKLQCQQLNTVYLKHKFKKNQIYNTIRIASLKVTVNSFNKFAWLFNLLRHACSGGAPQSKSNYKG